MNGIQVDGLGPAVDLLGFTNHWYPFVLETAVPHRLSDGTDILVPTAVAFVATKLEAYAGRANGACMSSKDIEDVSAVLDGRPEFSGELAAAAPDVRLFIQDGLRSLLSDPNFDDAVNGYLSSQASRVAAASGCPKIQTTSPPASCWNASAPSRTSPPKSPGEGQGHPESSAQPTTRPIRVGLAPLAAA